MHSFISLRWPLAGLLSACAIAGEAKTNHIAIEPVPPDAGGVRFAVVFHPSPEPVSALEFELEYDPAMSLFAAPGMAARESIKDVYVSEIAPNRKKFVIAGLNQTPIWGGRVVTLLASADPTGPGGEFVLRVASARAVYGNGAVAPIEGEGETLQLEADDLVPLGILNAASLAPSPVSPDAILTLVGRGIGATQIAASEGGSAVDDQASTRVAVNGIATEILYIGPDQINLIAPGNIEEQETAQIDIVRDAKPVAQAFSMPLAGADPALFTLAGSGAGQAASLNQDGSINEPANPEARGSIVALYGTGIGPTDVAAPDGTALARFPVSVMIGGIRARIEYAGAAPGAVTGLFQVNCRIPEDVEPGPAVEVRVTAGIYRSPPGVTIAVK